jgi:hypothetical protein
MSEPSDSDDDLEGLANALGGVTGFDRVATVFVDVIAAVPVAGPIIAAVARQVLPQDALIYLQLFAVEAARKIEALDDNKIDRSYLMSDEYREDLEQVFDAQTLRVQRRKRLYYLAAVKNAAVIDRPGEAERRRMLDALIRLRRPTCDFWRQSSPRVTSPSLAAALTSTSGSGSMASRRRSSGWTGPTWLPKVSLRAIQAERSRCLASNMSERG